MSAPFPDHIVLDTETKEVSWHTSSQEWIPENAIYNHLELKSTCVTRETTYCSAKRLVLGVYTTVRTNSCEETFNFFCVRGFDLSILNQSHNSRMPLVFGP
jgi:hypothetical protein